MKKLLTVEEVAAIEGNWDTKALRMTHHAKKLEKSHSLALTVINVLVNAIEQAIEIGDWKVDGRCDPDLALCCAKDLLSDNGYKKELDTMAEPV
jgi:hypothetical protein